jgi:hypothetical protein
MNNNRMLQTVVIEYIFKIIKDDDNIDIYDIKEDTYDEFICDELLNHWSEPGGYDIITEYFGNTSYFEPTNFELVFMINLITERRNDYGLDTSDTLFEGINIHHTWCNMLRHYAYHYINSLGYEDFKLELKDYIAEEYE